MRTVIQCVCAGTGLIAALLAATVATWGSQGTARAAENAWHATLESPPPTGQTYTGVKRCASCHLDQYMKWKKSGHSKAFEILTAKYQKDAKCLKCHTTGYGVATGFKDHETTPALEGNTCEMCHGPGSKHEEIAQKYAKIKKLSPEQDKEVRGSTWLVLPKNVCVECHLVQGHKDSQTPAELRGKK